MVAVHIILRATDNAHLFASGDSFCGTPVTRLSPVAHFSEHQRIVIPHNQVNFAASAVEIPREQRQSVLLKKMTGQCLGLIPDPFVIHGVPPWTRVHPG